MMHPQFKVQLQVVIQKWMDDHCEDDDWPEGIIGEQTVALMTDAAVAVFDAVMEVQEHGKREGFFAEA